MNKPLLTDEEIEEAHAEPLHIDYWAHGSELAWFNRIKIINVSLQQIIKEDKEKIKKLEAACDSLCTERNQFELKYCDEKRKTDDLNILVDANKEMADKSVTIAVMFMNLFQSLNNWPTHGTKNAKKRQ